MELVKNQLLIEFALIFSLYLYSVCILVCCLCDYMRYDCVKATIQTKTYFGMEKDKCVPTKPMNGVCMGVAYKYKSKDYTGYVQVDHDKCKIGGTIDLCVEKKDPSMFTTVYKKNMIKLAYWLLLPTLLVILSAIKLTLWSGKQLMFNKILVSGIFLGFVFGLSASWMKNKYPMQ